MVSACAVIHACRGQRTTLSWTPFKIRSLIVLPRNFPSSLGFCPTSSKGPPVSASWAPGLQTQCHHTMNTCMHAGYWTLVLMLVRWVLSPTHPPAHHLPFFQIPLFMLRIFEKIFFLFFLLGWLVSKLIICLFLLWTTLVITNSLKYRTYRCLGTSS